MPSTKHSPSSKNFTAKSNTVHAPFWLVSFESLGQDSAMGFFIGVGKNAIDPKKLADCPTFLQVLGKCIPNSWPHFSDNFTTHEGKFGTVTDSHKIRSLAEKETPKC